MKTVTAKEGTVTSTTTTTTMQVQIPMSIVDELQGDHVAAMRECGLTAPLHGPVSKQGWRLGDGWTMPTRVKAVGRGQSLVMFCSPEQVLHLIDELDWIAYAHKAGNDHYIDANGFLALSASKVAARLRKQLIGVGIIPHKSKH